MKSKQVLDIKQVQNLQKLGLKFEDTLMYWARCVDNNPRSATHYGKWVLVKGKQAQTVGLQHWEFIPAYTLQDILDLLPVIIKPQDNKLELRIKRFVFDSGIKYAVLYEKQDYIDWYVMQSDSVLIDAAYDMLCWCLENGYIRKEAQNENSK